MAKAVRGEVARALLEAKKPPDRSRGRRAIAEAAGFTVELSAGNLDVDRSRLDGPTRAAGPALPGRREVERGGGSGLRRSPRAAIVSRLERSISVGSSGQGVRTTAATSSPAARAASSVSRVWLIVPRPGEATTTSG